jgi:hypothetical protein
MGKRWKRALETLVAHPYFTLTQTVWFAGFGLAMRFPPALLIGRQRTACVKRTPLPAKVERRSVFPGR